MTTQTEALKRFLIGTSVENAEGSQIWYVDATTEKEALRIFNEGGADIYASEVEVTATGTPYIDGLATLDDFGDFNDKPLAQPEQEPVACVVPHGATMRLEWASVDAAHNAKIGPLYTTPPQRTWVGLTDKEIDELHGSPMDLEHSGALKWVRIIEAKLKEKNNG